jgi:ketopantoate reductase
MKRFMSSQQALPFMEPIHVLGGGSIGLLFASSIRMAFPSYPLTMLLRKHHEPRLEAEGNRKKFMEVCISHQNRPRIVRIPAAIIGSSETPTIRNLLVATKAPDASTAIESVRQYLHPSSRIMILCNGALAVRDEITDLLQEQQHPITLISTTHGAFRDEDDDGNDDELYHVTHAGVGKTFVQIPSLLF